MFVLPSAVEASEAELIASPLPALVIAILVWMQVPYDD
jgi:hypothetical protein